MSVHYGFVDHEFLFGILVLVLQHVKGISDRQLMAVHCDSTCEVFLVLIFVMLASKVIHIFRLDLFKLQFLQVSNCSVKNFVFTWSLLFLRM